jgi:hypothetical protein
MEERLAWLAGVLVGHPEMSAEELCDRVLAQLDDAVDDDVALLVLRVGPEDA